jgi:hypothetical protein
VKSGSITRAKSLKVFSTKYHPPYQIIFSGRSFDVEREKQVRHYPLYLAGRWIAINPLVKNEINDASEAKPD